jgi:glutamate N-acetyltransferase / amino-acid N-acetyltransferase
MSLLLPKAFRFAGVQCGIKPGTEKLDLALIVSDKPATGAGVYTQNRVFAAPVEWDRSRTPGENFQAVIINSGNANACTGQRGLRDAAETARLVGQAADLLPEQVLIMSTGVIGRFLPMDAMANGIDAAAAKLSPDERSFVEAATAIMTTDTVPKYVSRSAKIGGVETTVCGIAKGAAMIGPNMATMLGLVMTDAAVSCDALREMLREVVDQSFNCISVDGHVSTNDTVLLLANGASGGSLLSGADLATFQALLQKTCAELARMIPADGEGATHLIDIEITGCTTRDAARQIARSVADSPLVKTAIHGADPNWGRIVSAAGYAGIEFDPAQVSLDLNGFPLYRDGAPVEFDATVVSQSIRDNREIQIVLRFGEGGSGIRFWTADLTAEYVHLNADYTT